MISRKNDLIDIEKLRASFAGSCPSLTIHRNSIIVTKLVTEHMALKFLAGLSFWCLYFYDS